MSDQDEFDLRAKLAAINAEFDQFRAAMLEVATTVADYRAQLKKSRQFTKEETFMLTMEYQSMVLNAILGGNLGGGNSVPDFPPED